MDLPYLTPEQDSRFAALMDRIPAELHDDAIQELWRASLEDGDPVAAVNTWRMGEWRHYNHKNRFTGERQPLRGLFTH